MKTCTCHFETVAGIEWDHSDCTAKYCSCELHRKHSSTPWLAVFKPKTGASSAQTAVISSPSWNNFAKIRLNTNGNYAEYQREGGLNLALILTSPYFLEWSKQALDGKVDWEYLRDLVKRAETIPTLEGENL